VYQGRTHELIAVVIIQQVLLHTLCWSQIDLNEFLLVCRQMLEAVHFLHSRHVLHGDIKLNNWLIRCPPKGLAAGPTQGINICLIDFGKQLLIKKCFYNSNQKQTACMALKPHGSFLREEL
jgi:serine/threonine protein kinase